MVQLVGFGALVVFLLGQAHPTAAAPIVVKYTLTGGSQFPGPGLERFDPLVSPGGPIASGSLTVTLYAAGCSTPPVAGASICLRNFAFLTTQGQSFGVANRVLERSGMGFAAGDRPFSVAAADLDGDAVPDLLAGQFGYFGGGEHVGVLLGNGDGTFQSGGAFAAGTSPISVAVADLDGDTVPDGVTANADSDDVSVLLGNGDGTFQADLSFAVGNSPWSVAVADLDGDTVPDVVTANEGSNDVSVLRNLSDRGVPVLSPGALALLAALLAGTGSVVRIRTRRTTSFSR